MAAAGDLPRIPPAHRVAHVSVPDLLFGPDVDHDTRAQLQARAPDMTLFPAVSATVGVVLSIVAWTLLGPLAVPLVFATIMTGYGVAKTHIPARHARQQAQALRQARSAGQVIVPREDMDTRSLTMLRAVLMSVDTVATSRAQSAGHLTGGMEMLTEQRWRIARALVGLTTARAQIASTGVILPEQQGAVDVAERAVENRVRAMLGYAGSVRDLDQALAAVEAASRADSLDHTLRQTFDALGEGESLSAKVDHARTTHDAVEGALAALREQTDHLLSYRIDDPPGIDPFGPSTEPPTVRPGESPTSEPDEPGDRTAP